METKEKKPIFKKWWFWVIIVVVVIGIISAASGGSKKPSKTPDKETSSQGTKENDSGNKESEKTETAYEVGEGEVRIWTDSIGSTWISAALPVKNTGSDNLFLSSGTLDIEDDSGALVTTLRMVTVYPQVLLPGETAYYYEETTLDESVSQEGLKIVPHIDVKKAKVDCIRYEVTEVQVKDSSYGDVNVTGRVENTSEEAESMIYVVANLYAADGSLLAQQFTILSDELQPGEKIGFETSNLGYSFSAADVANYEIYAFPTQIQF